MRLAELPPEVHAVSVALRDFHAPWAVAGGWAIDLARGRVTRTHADVDVAVFRDDQDAVRAALPGWDFAAVAGGRMTPWERGARLEPPVHEVHARSPAPPFALELLLNERDGADWVYRRDPAVRLPLARALLPGPAGVRVLAPEVVLLYKSKAPRPADEADFLAAPPLLDAQGRAWLRDALLRARPDHPWAAALVLET